MTNFGKTSYHKQFMESTYDRDALAQDYKGNILHRVEGHVYVVRTFFGKYKIKKGRLSFRWPFQQVKLVKNVETSGIITFDDPITTNDGIDATQGQPINYLYEVVDKDKYYKNVFEKTTDLVQNVNIELKDIIGDIINSAILEDVRHNFSIERYYERDSEGNPVEKLRTPDWLKKTKDSQGNLTSNPNPIYEETLRKLKDIEEKYGIRINSIKTIDFNEPTQIREAREAAEAAKHKEDEAERLRNIKREDNKVEAEKEALKVKETLEKVKEFAESNHLSDDERQQLMIRVITPNASYTNTNFDMGAAASVLGNSQAQTSALQQMVSQQAATIQTLTQQIATMNAAIESMKAALHSQPTAQQQTVAQPTAQPSAQAQQAPSQAQQATAQAQQATAQAQKATAQAQQSTAQAQQDSNNVVDDQKGQTSAVDSSLNNKKVIRITSANRVPKKSRTDRRGGARRGRTQTPRRQHSHNLNPNAGNGMSRR